MARKYIFIIIIGMIVVAISFYFSLMNGNLRSKSKYTTVEGIENFTMDESKGDYILLYPADWRVSQEFTLVKEVTKDGEVIREYRIVDEDFRRAQIHQKPNDAQTLYLSLFGEPVIQNWFYTFDLHT